jgi:GxxExxY protein
MHPLNAISGSILDAAIRVHRSLGPGLLESVYEAVLAYELRERGHHVQTQVPIPVVWNDVRLEAGFRADLIVDHLVIVEIKSVEALAPVHAKQVITYLRLADKRLGLLINFNVDLLKDGVHRIVNNFDDAAHPSHTA